MMEKFVDDQYVLEQLDKSECFGIAHHPRAKECRQCDLANECWAKTSSNNLKASINTLNPETEENLKKAKAEMRTRTNPPKTEDEAQEIKRANRKRRKEVNKKIGLPETKKMSTDELYALLNELGGVVKEYDTERVQRMQLSIAIKDCLIKKYNRENPDDLIE